MNMIFLQNFFQLKPKKINFQSVYQIIIILVQKHQRFHAILLLITKKRILNQIDHPLFFSQQKRIKMRLI